MPGPGDHAADQQGGRRPDANEDAQHYDGPTPDVV